MDRIGRLFLVLRAALLASLAGGAVQAQGSPDEPDWLAAQADGSRRAFERYLQRHPLGTHAGEAFGVIARMSVDPSWSPDPLAAQQPGAPQARAVARALDVY